ncbi:hypothetical protein GQX74_002399 [Glossina fuscipes]|nr:hypothetical protein GQX74_002399 [Glossina fuscipes]
MYKQSDVVDLQISPHFHPVGNVLCDGNPVEFFLKLKSLNKIEICFRTPFETYDTLFLLDNVFSLVLIKNENENENQIKLTSTSGEELGLRLSSGHKLHLRKRVKQQALKCQST